MLTVEIKTNQMRKTKSIHSELTIARESATITCILAVTQRPAEEQESFVVGKKEGCWHVLVGPYWHEEAVCKLTKREASCVAG